MHIFIWPISFLFLLLPIIIYYLLPAKKESALCVALKVPFFKQLQAYESSVSFSGKNRLSNVFLTLSWICFVFACARPVWYPAVSSIPLEARNIVLSLDVSESMTETDFVLKNQQVDRLTAVKNVVDDFLTKREKDNIGLVLFADEAYTYAPLSYDKKTLKTLLSEVGFNIAGRMTALGDGLALAVQNALKVPAKTRSVILLSDGYANAGVVSVQDAVLLAKKHNIKVYSIGVGSSSAIQSFFGMPIPAPSTLDEETLKYIAQQTGGQYFLAQSTDELEKIYKIIDALEQDKSTLKSVRPRKELFFIPLFLGLIFMLIALFKRGKV